jgi:dTDP-4-dehydrorhamnose reductase
MTNILITGADGQLGSEIKKFAPVYSDFNFQFTDVSTLDICNFKEIESYFAGNQIDYIINCAAYTNVDKAESDITNAEKVNVEAVRNLAIISQKYKCKLLHISTDYVFDASSQNIPFKETDEPCAKSVYGMTKLKGEENAKEAYKYMIIRTSWLFSSFGNNFVKTILRIGKERSEIGVLFDQVGTPCYAADLAGALLKIIDVSAENVDFKSGIYHYSNEGVCSWYDFALEIAKKSKLNCKIKPIETRDYPLPAKRPAYSVLNKLKIKETFGIEIPHWTDGLERCLNIITETAI